MSVLRAIVVDDEPLARDGLAADLRSLDVDVVSECADGFSAVNAMREHRPDAVFLDIAMPELDGFGVLERLEPEEAPPVVIFVTAFDAHAVRAFEAQALDYLLKPVANSRLVDTLARAERRVAEAKAHQALLASEAGVPLPSETGRGHSVERLLLHERGKMLVVPTSDLEWIEADGYYVRLHTTDGARPRLLRERMSVLENRLDPRQFVRTHRSAIVRLACVRGIRALTRYEYVVDLTNGHEAPLSRERRRRLESALSELPTPSAG